MNKLSEDDIKQLARNEWARYMEAYGCAKQGSQITQHYLGAERRARSVARRRQLPRLRANSR